MPTGFTHITPTVTVALGQKAFSLTGTSSPVLTDGLITMISENKEMIGTSMFASDISSVVPGSPLFDITGAVIGIAISTGDAGSGFYSIAPIVQSVPVL